MEIRDPIVDHLFTVADVAVAVLVFTIALVLYDRVSHSIKLSITPLDVFFFISLDITDHFSTIQ
jgi:hypothetical protein